MPSPSHLECPCRASPLLTGRSEEEPFGTSPFLGLAACAAFLGGIHFFVRDWGWGAWLIMLALESACLFALWSFIGEVRAQRRDGLVWVRTDAESATLGGDLGISIGPGRSLAGLEEIEVRLRCVEAFMRNGETTGADGEPEEVRVCYQLWGDTRRIEGAELTGDREARVQFTLPLAGDLAGPSGRFQERYWEVELVRHGGAANLHFRVLVYS